MSAEFFERLVRAAEPVFGRRKPGDASRGWPDREDAELHAGNLAEFPTTNYETFARWFEDADEYEVLVVISNVHPSKDFSEFIEETNEALPYQFEIEAPDPGAGKPICVAYMPGPENETDDADQDIRDILDLGLRQLRAIADHVADHVGVL